MHRYYLVRTSWLFGASRRNFVRSILGKARLREPITVVTDQTGCPTYTRDLAAACVDLAQTGCYGVYHVTNQGSTTWYGLAEYVVRACRMGVRVSPISSDELKRPANRPRSTRLDAAPLAATIGYLLRDWTEAVLDYLKTEEMLAGVEFRCLGFGRPEQ